MGKYDKVLPGLDRVRQHEGDGPWREKVDAIKKELGALSAANLAEAYGQLRAEREKAEAVVSEINVRLAAVEERMWGAFEDEDLSALKLRSGKGVRVQPEPRTKVVDKDALREWYVEQGLERLLNPAWQSLNSMSKERLLAGDDLPPGVEVKVFPKTVFSKK